MDARQFKNIADFSPMAHYNSPMNLIQSQLNSAQTAKPYLPRTHL